MGVGIVYSGGGTLDEVKNVNINLFPKCTTPYNKGFRVSIPAIKEVYSIDFDIASTLLAGKKTEIASYSFACSGYGDGDYIDIYINDIKIEDTWYTKEVAEECSIATGFTVYALPNNSKIKVEFHNESATSKTFWFKVKMLYNP